MILLKREYQPNQVRLELIFLTDSLFFKRNLDQDRSIKRFLENEPASHFQSLFEPTKADMHASVADPVGPTSNLHQRMVNLRFSSPFHAVTAAEGRRNHHHSHIRQIAYQPNKSTPSFFRVPEHTAFITTPAVSIPNYLIYTPSLLI